VTNDHTTFEIDGFKCVIAYEESASRPDDWDDGPTCFLGRLEVSRFIPFGRSGWGAVAAQAYIPFGEGPWDFSGKDQCEPAENVDSEEELRVAWQAQQERDYLVFPVRLNDHGVHGGRLVECEHHEAHGYVFIQVPWSSDLERLIHTDFHPEELLKSLLSTWNQYLSGDVHHARIEDNDENILDSCGDFYGTKGAEEWCKEQVQHLKESTAKHQVLVTRGSLANLQTHLVEVEVPIHVGEAQVPAWVAQNMPYDNLIQIDIYRGNSQ